MCILCTHVDCSHHTNNYDPFTIVLRVLIVGSYSHQLVDYSYYHIREVVGEDRNQ